MLHPCFFYLTLNDLKPIKVIDMNVKQHAKNKQIAYIIEHFIGHIFEHQIRDLLRNVCSINLHFN